MASSRARSGSVLPRCLIARFGKYTVWRGDLAADGSRSYYVDGPCLDGRIAPIAYFWRSGQAICWAIDRKAVQMTRNNDNLLPRLGWLVAIFVAFFGGC